LGANNFVADHAVIVGDVIAGDDCSFWFHAVVRADVNAIRIGNKVNIQDGAIIHCTYEKADTVIGNNVSIGHRAIVHGCHIDDNVLIGMGAIVMDHVHVPSLTVIGAGALVPEGQKLESGWVYAGIPAKKLKPLDKEQLDFLITRTADNYVKYAGWFDQ
jgi:carbonic anhydrase/acetyltransferase-like protein (isoleucine patch superfamily)